MVDNVDFLFGFIEGMPVGIACADTTGKTSNHFNTYFLQMFGWDREEINTLDKWFQKAYPDEQYRTGVIATWNEIIQEAKACNQEYSQPMEAKVACKDGSFKWCEVRYYGKGHYVYGIFTDISERKKVEKKLHELSLIDPLTEVYNRRYFNLEICERWNLSQRSQTPISLIMCDIDDFKKINDTHGHLVGDQVLAAVARAISLTLKRSTDFVARFGGEEFAIISYDCDEQSALGLCTMIKHNVENVNVPDVEDEHFTCTMSFGINTTIANAATTTETFINEADQALYRAKTAGKNQIVIHYNQ